MQENTILQITIVDAMTVAAMIQFVVMIHAHANFVDVMINICIRNGLKNHFFIIK